MKKHIDKIVAAILFIAVFFGSLFLPQLFSQENDKPADAVVESDGEAASSDGENEAENTAAVDSFGNGEQQTPPEYEAQPEAEKKADDEPRTINGVVYEVAYYWNNHGAREAVSISAVRELGDLWQITADDGTVYLSPKSNTVLQGAK